MTDKEQIIIDGVDVSGCLFYQSNFEEDYDVKIKHFCSNWHNSCESANNSNCYFKQLARKTAECEKEKQNAKDTYEMWQALIKSFNISQKENSNLRQALDESMQECIDSAKVIEEYSQKQRLA